MTLRHMWASRCVKLGMVKQDRSHMHLVHSQFLLAMQAFLGAPAVTGLPGCAQQGMRNLLSKVIQGATDVRCAVRCPGIY